MLTIRIDADLTRALDREARRRRKNQERGGSRDSRLRLGRGGRESRRTRGSTAVASGQRPALRERNSRFHRADRRHSGLEVKRGAIVVVAARGAYTGKPRPALVVQSDLFNPTPKRDDLSDHIRLRRRATLPHSSAARRTYRAADRLPDHGRQDRPAFPCLPSPPRSVGANPRRVGSCRRRYASLAGTRLMRVTPPPALLPPQTQRPEKLLRHFRRIPHQRSGAFFREPVGGEVVSVGGVEEALVEEGDDAGVFRRTDQAGRRPGRRGSFPAPRRNIRSPSRSALRNSP